MAVARSPTSCRTSRFTPEFGGQRDSWEYLMHQTDVVEFGTTHPLNETGPLAKQIQMMMGP